METRLAYSYASKEERLEAWQRNRGVYNSWRDEYGEEWIEKKRIAQSQLCFICLVPLGKYVHVDHIFPLYLGGTNALANLSVTHPPCNMQKGATVTMTYKQACRRRQLFNSIRRGHKAVETKKKKPKFIPSKKQVRHIANYKKYVVQQPYADNRL